MLSDPNSNLWRNSLLAAMHDPNCFYQFFSNHVLEQIAYCTRFERTDRLGVTTISSQHNDTSVWKLLTNSYNCISPVHDRHLQIHQRYVGTMDTQLLNPFTS